MMDRLISLDSYLNNQKRLVETLLVESEGKAVFHLGGNEYRVQLAERLRMIQALQYMANTMNATDKHALEVMLRGRKI